MAKKRSKTERVLKKLKIETAPAGDSELILDCPDPGCANPKKHMYMNRSTGLFICHRCGITGNLITFLTIVKGISFKQAQVYFSDETEGLATLPEIRERLSDIKLTAKEIIKTSGLKNIIEPPPYSMPIAPTVYPKFLRNRNVPYALAKMVKVRFCNSGRYNGRIIFPFTCDGNKSFVAYATYKWQEPKTLNPPGSYNKDLLYGYDLINKTMPKIVKRVPKIDALIVVEGIFDWLRLTLYGYKCVALMKSYLSKNQAILLNDCNYSKIIFMLDGDVEDGEYPRKLRHKNCIDSKQCFIAKIPDTSRDPDKLSEAEATEYITKSISRGGELSIIKKRLKELRKEH